LSKPCWDTFKVSGVKLPIMYERILQGLEDFQLAIEVLKSRGFLGSFYCLGLSLPSCIQMESSSLRVAPWSLMLGQTFNLELEVFWGR
jgi:hypothetical protein